MVDVVVFPYHLPAASAARIPWNDDDIFFASRTFPHEPADRANSPACAALFDYPTRRWYLVISHHVTPEGMESMDDTYWANILRQSNHRQREYEEFNCITVAKNDGSLSFSVYDRMYDRVMDLRGTLQPPSETHVDVPRVTIHDLADRAYLRDTVENVQWQSKPAVFKQICIYSESKRFHVEVEAFQSLRSSPFFPDILAFVVDENGMMRGFLLPFCGDELSSSHAIPLHHSIFLDLMKAMSDPKALYKEPHGDLCSRNILVSNDGNHLMVIDPGNPVIDYPGDRHALVAVLTEEDVLKRLETELDREKVRRIQEKLEEGWGYQEIVYGRIKPGRTDSRETLDPV